MAKLVTGKLSAETEAQEEMVAETDQGDLLTAEPASSVGNLDTSKLTARVEQEAAGTTEVRIATEEKREKIDMKEDLLNAPDSHPIVTTNASEVATTPTADTTNEDLTPKEERDGLMKTAEGAIITKADAVVTGQDPDQAAEVLEAATKEAVTTEAVEREAAETSPTKEEEETTTDRDLHQQETTTEVATLADTDECILYSFSQKRCFI